MRFAGFAASNDCESLLNLSCWSKTKLPCYLPERPSENQHFLLFLLSASHNNSRDQWLNNRKGKKRCNCAAECKEGVVFVVSLDETEVIDSSCTNFTRRTKLTTKLEGDALSPSKTERCLSCNTQTGANLALYSGPSTADKIPRWNKQIQSFQSGEMAH